MSERRPDEGQKGDLISVQWFPGHMTKTTRLISDHLKLVDAVTEIIDARIPRSSRNPLIDELVNGKKRVVILNKADLSSENANALWKRSFESRGIPCVLVSCTTGEGINQFYSTLKEQLKEKIDRDTARGMRKQITTMVLGVPNVGKSTFINRIAGEKRAKAEDRAGVTRGKQWVRLNNGIDLLDMPGLLWHKFEDMSMGLNLAYTGAINDNIIDIEGVAASLCKKLAGIAPDALCARYKLSSVEELGDEPLMVIGKKRGFLLGRGEIDTERTAKIILDEFRGAKIGRITLELPGESE